MDFSGDYDDVDDDVPTKRGAAPTLIELFILSWVSGKETFVLNPCFCSNFSDDRRVGVFLKD